MSAQPEERLDGQPIAAVEALWPIGLREVTPMDPVAVRRLLGRLPIGVVSVNARLEVDYVNPAGRIHLETGGPGELVPEPWPAFSLRTFVRRLFTDSPPPSRVVETADGCLLELEGIGAGERNSALLLIQDVTARERRRRAEQEFVANASHELRTPVAAIASAVEVLQAGAKEEPIDRDLFLAHIARENDRLGRLTESLLLLARLQTRQAVTDLAVVEVRPLLEEVAAQLEPRDGVEIRLSCGPGTSLLADRDLLCQAVLNVAANAVRHTTAGEVELACRENGSVCEIDVRDTGPGIPEADRARVFDRFVRLGNGRDGFGLGLAITREIVRALGGTVELESVVGDGTRVRLRLTAARVVRP